MQKNKQKNKNTFWAVGTVSNWNDVLVQMSKIGTIGSTTPLLLSSWWKGIMSFYGLVSKIMLGERVIHFWFLAKSRELKRNEYLDLPSLAVLSFIIGQKDVFQVQFLEGIADKTFRAYF